MKIRPTSPSGFSLSMETERREFEATPPGNEVRCSRRLKGIRFARRYSKGVRKSGRLHGSSAASRQLGSALLDADPFEDLPGKWQAAIVKAEQKRPKLRLVTSD